MSILIFLIIWFVALSIPLWIHFLKESKETKRECRNCKNRSNMGCPNSALCYSTEDKPYFEPKEKEKKK